MNIHIKYYPENYSEYPNDMQRSQWFFTFKAGLGYFVHNSAYNTCEVVPEIQAIIPVGQIFLFTGTFPYIDYNTNYYATLGDYNFKANFVVEDTFYKAAQVNSFLKTMWTTGVDWSPESIPTFKNNCVTFITNNNPLNWTDISLDIWVEQNITGSLPGLSHIFIYYEGNNPAADEVVVI